MVTFPFRCPICKSKRIATDNIIGRRVRCADCNNFVEVPAEALKQAQSMKNDPQQPQKSTPTQKQDQVFDLGAPTEPFTSPESSNPLPPAEADFFTPSAVHGDSHDTGLIDGAPPGATRELIFRWKEEPEEGGIIDNSVSFRSARPDEETEMDMTPMVDVTFLLLIFFMVTASFTIHKTKEQPPQKDDQPSTNVTLEDFEDDPDFAIVYIDEYNTYHVTSQQQEDEEAPSEQELLIKLRIARDGGTTGRRPTKLLVNAHGEALHEKVITAMDVGTEVGFSEIRVSMTEDSSF